MSVVRVIVPVKVPVELAAMSPHLADFFERMVAKLEKNKHKSDRADLPGVMDIPKLLDLMLGEVQEFRYQYAEDKQNDNAQMELADIANFAFLISLALKAGA